MSFGLSRCTPTASLAVLLLLSVPAFATERARAVVDCRPAGEPLTYDCTVRLERRASGEPLSGAGLIIGADMPSMPMAHNVSPVEAKALATAGDYAARLKLEMHGDWALRLRISGPLEDLIVQTLRFEADGVAPAGPLPRGSGSGAGSGSGSNSGRGSDAPRN